MHSLTQGSMFVYLDQFSDLSCKIWRFFFHLGEGFTNWTLALLNLERVFALQDPFFTRKHITATKVKFAIFTIFLLNLGIASIAFDVYRIVPSKANKLGIICMGTFSNAGLFEIALALALMIGNFVLPIIFKCILVLILLRKLRIVTRKVEIQKHVKNAVDTTEEIGVILTVTISQIILYTPFTISWTLVTSFVDVMDPDLANLMVMIKRLFLDLSAGVHVWNFYIYLKRIPIFRKEFRRIVCGSTENNSLSGISNSAQE